MTEQSSKHLPPTENAKASQNSKANLLKAGCHSLIGAIARRPGAVKLLQGAREALLIYSAYKANRSHSSLRATMPRWTEQSRQRQSELIRQWEPWQHSTGPTTLEGKARSSQNARLTG
jgi:hypothetical protein